MEFSGGPFDEFEQLRKLLGLKRHEPPPPGYFLLFRRQLLARLGRELQPGAQSWWQRWLTAFDAKPALACAYGLMVAGLLLFGMEISHQLQVTETSLPASNNPWLALTPSASLVWSEDFIRNPLAQQAEPSSSIYPVVSPRPHVPLFPGVRIERSSFNF